MKTYNVSHSEKDGFALHIIDVSTIRTAISTTADRLCAWTGHHFCTCFGKIDAWAHHTERELLVISLTKEQAFKVSDTSRRDWLEEDNE